MKIKEEEIVNADTFLVPSASEEVFELEADLKPIEIKFDDLVIEDMCNSEGALDMRDMIEIEAVEHDLVGRSSENGIMRCGSPQPKLENN